jgi:hypothetical protein
MQVAAFLLWSLLGLAVGWAGAVAKAALLAHDPGWADLFYLITLAIWVVGLFLGALLLGALLRVGRLWLPRSVLGWAGALSVLFCVAADLTGDYLRWRPQPGQPSGIAGWLGDYATRATQVYSRRAGGHAPLPQIAVVLIQGLLTGAIVIPTSAKQSHGHGNDR